MAPTIRCGMKKACMPPTWYSGAMCSAMSRRERPYSITQFMAIATSLPWLCITPFGRPVVPDV